MNWIESKHGRVRLTSCFNVAVRALFLMVLSGALVISSVACSLSMGVVGPGNMPSGSDSPSDNCHHKNRQRCPLSICDAGASYVALDVSRNMPLLLQELPSEVIVPNSLWTLVASALVVRPTGESPGFVGARFLQTHSLLI